SANFTETYDTKHVGTSKTLTPAGTVTDGNSGNNYSYTLTPVSTGTINKLAITATAVSNTKTYDGTTAASATPSKRGAPSSDTANFTETYDTRHVGTSKTLTPAGTVTDGNSGNNYSYTFTPVSTGTINKLAITATAVSNTKTYDGTTAA